MTIQLEAYVNIASDNDYDIFDKVGSIIVHIDGGVVEEYDSQIKMQKIKDATDYFGPLYSIDIPEAMPISIQHWVIQNIQEGRAIELLEEDDTTNQTQSETI